MIMIKTVESLSKSEVIIRENEILGQEKRYIKLFKGNISFESPAFRRPQSSDGLISSQMFVKPDTIKERKVSEQEI
jgi:hypothetical protein